MTTIKNVIEVEMDFIIIMEIVNCPEKFYKNGANCTGSHENCKQCSKGVEIEKNGIAHENCETCEMHLVFVKAEGFSRNCTNECPNGTNISESSNLCIIINNDDENKKKR